MLRVWMLGCLVLAAVGVVVLSPLPAAARLAYQKQFYNLYLTDETSEEYTDFVRKEAKCWVCHQGKKRKNHNLYGEALEDKLKRNEKDVDKIVEALKKVGEMHSDPDDDTSLTFDELIADEKLPGGELEELKEDPDPEDEEDEDEEDEDEEDEDEEDEDEDESDD